MQISRVQQALRTPKFVLSTALDLLVLVPLRMLFGRNKQNGMSFVDWLRGPGVLAALLILVIARVLLP